VLVVYGHDIMVPLLLTFVAGMSTILGSLVFLLVRDYKRSYLVFSLGLSAGAMIYISFIELLHKAVMELGFAQANVMFFIGIIAMMLVDFLLPHQYLEETELGPDDNKLAKSGYMVAIGLAIHNFPEGMAVFLSGLVDIKLGAVLAFAIAMHNIPEGVAVSMPIYYATKSKSKAFWYAFFSGIVEPIGAIVALLVIGPNLTQALVAKLFAFVAGVMVFISFDELLPHAFGNKYHHHAIYGLLLGMGVMAISLAI
jgi:zinc transporter, ZIP family